MSVLRCVMKTRNAPYFIVIHTERGTAWYSCRYSNYVYDPCVGKNSFFLTVCAFNSLALTDIVDAHHGISLHIILISISVIIYSGVCGIW
jgi:hypothetical protein